jgi:hypothetical protein
MLVKQMHPERLPTLSHPSKAHRPAYSATAQEDALVDVPSNHPIVFQSWFACPDAENPVIATTMPITVTPSNATNLKYMNMSPILVPNFVDIQFNNVTPKSPTSATDLLIQLLTFSASAPIAARTRYSPIMMDMMAEDPGFKTITAHHVKRNPKSSPKILDR